MGAGVCLVQGRFSGASYCGTGFLIAPNRVLTAAHNVHTGRVLAHDAVVSFKQLGSVVISAENIHVLSAYYDPLSNPYYSADDYDVALLRLDRAIPGMAVPWRPLPNPTVAEGLAISVMGFAACTLQPSGRTGHTGELSRYRTLFHDVPSATGFSGGPVAAQGGAVIAIHTYGLPDGASFAGEMAGRCIVIDDIVMEFIRRDGLL